MNCRIDKMAQGGRGFARLDGKVVFVDGALPGELVSIEYTRRRKDFDEARVVQILEPHAQRVQPACGHYGRCGGCNLQHASIELQRDIKRQVVDDLFRRIAKTSLPPDWPMHGGQPWSYRQRVRFVRGAEGWGFRRESSHAVEPVHHCPVLSPALQDLIAKLPDLRVDSELQAIAPSAHGEPVLWKTERREGDVPPVEISVLGRKLWADARVFFQSNLELMPILLESVLHEAEQCERHDLAVDLFSGVGVFAAFLQDRFQKVIAVEWNRGCLAHAKRNLGANCEFCSSSAEDYLEKQSPRDIDLLVVDPPRLGLSPDVRKALLRSQPKWLIYVSCDPVTLARDAGDFVRHGWTLQRAAGFDFYPQTAHLEMLAVLTPGNS